MYFLPKSKVGGWVTNVPHELKVEKPVTRELFIIMLLIVKKNGEFEDFINPEKRKSCA